MDELELGHEAAEEEEGGDDGEGKGQNGRDLQTRMESVGVGLVVELLLSEAVEAERGRVVVKYQGRGTTGHARSIVEGRSGGAGVAKIKRRTVQTPTAAGRTHSIYHIAVGHWTCSVAGRLVKRLARRAGSAGC